MSNSRKMYFPGTPTSPNIYTYYSLVRSVMEQENGPLMKQQYGALLETPQAPIVPETPSAIIADLSRGEPEPEEEKIDLSKFYNIPLDGNDVPSMDPSSMTSAPTEQTMDKSNPVTDEVMVDIDNSKGCCIRFWSCSSKSTASVKPLIEKKSHSNSNRVHSL